MARILVVDDDPVSVRMLEALLSSKAHEVITAHDGAEGLHKAKNESLNLIILDILMPRMDGIKVCRTLKHSVHHKHIPIIMLSVLEDEGNIKAAMDAGAEAYIVKPHDPKELLAKIEEFLKSVK